MNRKPMDYAEHYAAVLKAMTSGGLLLGACDPEGKANIMTIGWGAVGSTWGMAHWTVLVRPSRYTYQCIEHSGCFTVNVPTAAMKAACAICGSLNGADVDKFEEADLTPGRAQNIDAPIVEQCPIIYECRVVNSNDIQPQRLAEEIQTGCYADGDYHRVYWGKIIAAYAAENAADCLNA